MLVTPVTCGSMLHAAQESAIDAMEQAAQPVRRASGGYSLLLAVLR